MSGRLPALGGRSTDLDEILNAPELFPLHVDLVHQVCVLPLQRLAAAGLVDNAVGVQFLGSCETPSSKRDECAAAPQQVMRNGPF